MSKYALISGLLLGACCFTSVLSQDNTSLVLSLEECEKLAFENNPKIKDAEFGVEHAETRRTEAKNARILPKFELRNVWGPIPKAEGRLDPTGSYVIQENVETDIPQDLSYFTDLEINLVQPLYTFGRLKGLNRAARFGVQAEHANLEKEQESVRLEVRKLYWGLLLGREILTVIDDARNEVRKAEEKIEEKLDEGAEDVTQNDLFKLQVFKYEVNKRYREARDRIEIAEAGLRAALGLDEDAEFELADEYIEPLSAPQDSLPYYIGLALENRPELMQVRAGVNAKRALVGVSRSELYPQFFFAGQIKWNYAPERFDPKGQYIHNLTNFFRPGFVVGLDLNLNFWQTRNKIRRAQVEYSRLAHKETLLLEGVKLEVEKIYTELKQAEANMRDSRKALKASENWLRSTSMTWDIGVGDVKEFIDAYKANSTMKAEHFENIFNFNVALARLSKAVGTDLYSN